ncbi:MEKHLA domain-containing protein [Cognatishimia maritima]|uniref:MEKHLA domain-containing protein n=1 Tax=Cognatishimia maritima TaxID=870908 RepID=A0A1M5IV76_9RHOB|nr:MEKHLA domain-containing protein [Cognatishimia maritima]SHG32227.1 MEKHLA domain-containing protein [Cognatishimia maritima]
MERPSDKNAYQAKHALLLLRSYVALIGEPLLPTLDAKPLYEAPFPVLSHNTAADPILTYGNLAAQQLWEMSWEDLTILPSRLTAEPNHRDQRAHMFEVMRETGFYRNYEGIRVSATGRRFQIRNATIWTLFDDMGQKCGEAATFTEFEYL